ncbi:hypothetical protein CL620_05255 [archaeon]|jgi:hypothetical protein|nr:hypothetical protein [archaeon]|tara:strand:+ start:3162 stop:4979 length:1818 start_codon:yes stop_codon:yes gene_type:complete
MPISTPFKDIPVASVANLSVLMAKLIKEKKISREFQERRHKEWNVNYELYRNKVKTNRLTQRQAVNIPLMKETVKTLLSKIDDPPSVDWKELGGNQDKEIILQEIWNDDFERLNFEGVDIQDKKTVMLCGRAFKKLNIDAKGFLDVRPLDIFDVVVDPMVDPLDIETARFIIHQNIFRSLREVLADERYSKDAKSKLRIWASGTDAIVQSNRNKQEWEKKVERLKSMGVENDQFAQFAGGDVILNLSEHYTLMWNTKKQDFEKRVIVYADDEHELLNETLEDLLGVDFWPFVTWGEDIETMDFWSDGPADLVRTPNQILNVWFSQMVENRTLKNFQMHWYDATVQGYKPQTYEPGAGRMLPAPGNPKETIMPVDISGLDDTFTAIDFLIRVIERGTAATAIEKGVSEKKQITLGEVEMLVGKALERTLSMAKMYRRSWFDLALKWERILDANSGENRTLHKTARSGKIWEKVVYPSDWKSDKGYKPIVRSTSEQEEEQTKGIQKFMFIQSRFPDNFVLNRIVQKRMLEIVDLTPEEIREVQEAEKKKQEAIQREAEAAARAEGTPGEAPTEGTPVAEAVVKEPATDAEEDELLSQLESRLNKVKG